MVIPHGWCTSWSSTLCMHTLLRSPTPSPPHTVLILLCKHPSCVTYHWWYTLPIHLVMDC